MLNISNTKDINTLIELEQISLSSTLDIQKNLNKQVLVFMKKYMNTIDFSNTQFSNCENFNYLSIATSTLGKTNDNITIINELLNCLFQIDTTLPNLEETLENYNNEFKNKMNSIYKNTEEIEAFIHKATINNFSELPNLIQTENLENTNSTNTENSKFIENTLIISSTQGKVILPYKTKELEDHLQKNNNYQSYEDVINNLYTKSINYYKFSSIARFKEAYKLIREKEKGSIIQALSLAIELLGNYNLHPAIITACNSVDELDIYLACLDENCLSDFKFFDIKYEIPLIVSKTAKSNT